ncbi:MAG: hypothetical protein QF530_13060 [SAR202 cluster bacterium]|jgi:hypothetical protein|nr:hypothetical protein [SAR202 cluster bacterium]
MRGIEMNLKSVSLLLLLLALMLLVGCGDDTERSGVRPKATNDTNSDNKQGVVDQYDWEYVGFTHAPVDFQLLMSEDSLCPYYPALQPFFNYFIPSHTEGPKKWYLGTCSEDPVKVYLPVKALLRDGGIRIYADEVTGGSEGARTAYDGHQILSDVQAYFEASMDVTVFFMHLTLLEQIKSSVEESDRGYVVLEAGTHIGYLKSPDAYDMDYNVVDFGVSDKRVNAGLTENDDHWWDIRANPFDYFSEEVKGSILAAYKPVYDRMAREGTYPFTDIEDSRLNLNENGRIWGTWFKDDLSNGFDGAVWASDWSLIHFTKTDDLARETFWKYLEEHSGLSGLLVEANRLDAVGKRLYNGRPNGKSGYYLLSGSDSSGLAKIESYFSQREGLQTRYLRFLVTGNTESTLDDILTLEAFDSHELAKSSDFSDEAVRFRRTPCKTKACV